MFSSKAHSGSMEQDLVSDLTGMKNVNMSNHNFLKERDSSKNPYMNRSVDIKEGEPSKVSSRRTIPAKNKWEPRSVKLGQSFKVSIDLDFFSTLVIVLFLFNSCN